jgi:hypothetical protein
VLAVIKAGIIAGRVTLHQESDDSMLPSRRIDQKPDLLGLFASEQEFVAAAGSLVRFGFIEAASGWGKLAFSATDVLFEYLENIYLELLTPA